MKKKKVEFFLSMDPPTATHQMKQINWKTKSIYEPTKVKEARRQLHHALAPHAPVEPLRGAIRLIVKWIFPNTSNDGPVYKITKPDTDNLQKLLKDEMTLLGFWEDDAQVASEIVEKFQTSPTGIYIRAEEIDESIGKYQI